MGESNEFEGTAHFILCPGRTNNFCAGTTCLATSREGWGLPEKLILYLDIGKGVRLAGALGSLNGVSLVDALHVHMDVGMSQWTVKHQ
jgi:hypothetical protein